MRKSRRKKVREGRRRRRKVSEGREGGRRKRKRWRRVRVSERKREGL